MREIVISKNEAGQRLNKLLMKYLDKAPSSFVYRMIRKKNIKLNNAKAVGNEIVYVGDVIQLFLSDETINSFRNEDGQISGNLKENKFNPEIVYHDDNILIVNKPVGVLSQKASKDDYSVNESVIDYLLENGYTTQEQLRTFKPSICNRLDRNTEGLITAGISLMGSRCLSEIIKDRTIHKLYYTIESGKIGKTIDSSAYITKDRKNNKAVVSRDKTPESEYIHSIFTPVACNGSYTLVKVELITGKSHQIRAQLKHLGYPLIGDRKYGDKRVNRYFADRYGLKNQLLICGEYVFGDIKNELSYMSGKTIKADFPDHYNRICKDLF